MEITLRTKILVGVALAIVAYVVAGPSDEQTVETAKGTGSHSVRVARSTNTASHARDPSRMLYSLTHRVAATNSAGTLFAPHSWYVPPPPPPPAPAPVLTAAQEAALKTPVAPPLSFTYMGSYTAAGSPPVIFLTQGDRVYNVKVGDSLNDLYSVDSFANGQLVMTYKPLKIQQQLIVGSAQ